MKLNKIVIRVAHFFGCMKSREHQDDITINIPNYPNQDIGSDWWRFAMDKKFDAKDLKYIKDDIHLQIIKQFIHSPKTRKRCANVKQVWVTYYLPGEPKIGSIINMFRYENDKVVIGKSDLI